jgi:hypothetical protein
MIRNGRSPLNQVEEAVAKPAIGVGSTRKVTAADQERLEELRACPVLLQEYIAGDTVRVHIVGESVVLALRILSEGQVDSRTAPQGFLLGLHYAAWDIIATPDHRYVYLDCNPGPYILWIGPEYIQVVLRQLAIYMLTYAYTRSLEAASREVKPWQPSPHHT